MYSLYTFTFRYKNGKEFDHDFHGKSFNACLEQAKECAIKNSAKIVAWVEHPEQTMNSFVRIKF